MRKVRSTSISNRSTILVSRCFSSGFSAIANAAISRNGSLTSARLGLAGIFAMHWEQLVERDQQRVSAGDDRRVGQRMAKLVTALADSHEPCQHRRPHPTPPTPARRTQTTAVSVPSSGGIEVEGPHLW